MNKKQLLLSIILIQALLASNCDSPQSKEKLKEGTYSTQTKNNLSLESKIKTIEGWYDEAYDFTKAGGYGIAIIKDGNVLLKKTYGYSNEEHKISFDFETMFNFASIAKQFTGFAVAKLIQMEKLSLNDNIRKYLPEIHDFGHKITIGHLLNHSSGLRDWVPLTKLSGRLENDVINGKQIMKLINKQKELNFIPGEKHAYSNTGYFLLAHIVGNVTQMPFDEWVKKNIYIPIGMGSTISLNDIGEIIPKRAESYVSHGKGKYQQFTTNSSVIGSSDLWSTMDDMIKWLLYLDTNELDDENILKLMTSPSSLNNGVVINYNFGLQKGIHHGREFITHGGSWGGYASELVHFPKERLSFLFFSNRNPSGVYLRHNVIDLILDIEQQPSSEDIANADRLFIDLDVKSFDNYLGSYALKLKEPDGNRIYYLSRVFIKNNRLVATSSMYNNNRLFPISEKKFFIKGDTNEYEFFTDKENICYQYIITHGENEYTFLKMEKKVQDLMRVKELLGEYYSKQLNTTYLLTIKDGELTFVHPVNEDALFIKLVMVKMAMQAIHGGLTMLYLSEIKLV